MAATRTFSQLVAAQAAAVQGKAAGLVDFTVGSLMRAFAEANAYVALWLQGLILELLTTTRAATSRAGDLDTWMADFGLTRVGAIKALGDVTVSRFTPTVEGLVSLGATVETADGSQRFEVVADATNPAWDGTRQAYAIAPGIASLTVPVRALVAGAAGNVAAGAVTVLSGAMPGIDTVINAQSFFSGGDAETDAAFRVRFQLFIASLSRAVKIAVDYAIASLEQNISHVLVENETYDGELRRGHFYVIINDGTGSPTSETLSLVAGAIEQVRPLGITFEVFPPQAVEVNVSLIIHLAPNADALAARNLVSAAIERHISGLGMGGAVRLTRIAQLAYGASESVTNVTGLSLNGGAADIVTSAKQLAKKGLITVGVA